MTMNRIWALPGRPAVIAIVLLAVASLSAPAAAQSYPMW
jgi:hypothetical protein